MSLSTTPAVSLSAMSLLFSEIVQYSSARVHAIVELEGRLSAIGESVGARALDMIACRGEPELSGVALMRRARRDRTPRVARSRCLDLVPILQFIQTTVWKGLFDHAADRLEKSTERPNEFYIYDSNVLTNKFISVPKEMGALNCAAFAAGVIKGVLDTADFAASVDAHYPSDEDHFTTVFVIRFEPHIMQRHKASS
ncbi:Trafficking protein particle complex subunit [Plasmodiophora brassicae]